MLVQVPGKMKRKSQPSVVMVAGGTCSHGGPGVGACPHHGVGWWRPSPLARGPHGAGAGLGHREGSQRPPALAAMFLSHRLSGPSLRSQRCICVRFYLNKLVW